MAKLIQTKHGAGAVNAGEERLLKFLEVNLPDNYFIVSNVEFANVTPQGQVQYLEYDCIVITPHALYHIENKDWSGRLEGDDTTWYLSGSEKPNPLKTVRFKTSVLASNLKAHNPFWATAWIESLLTLSHPRQNKKGLWGACEKATYLLDTKLINYICNPVAVRKPENCIADISVQISNFIAGLSSPRAPQERKEVHGYDIIETLALDKCYSEYLCKTKGMVTANRYRVKEYILDLAGLSPAEQEKRALQIQNQQMALSKMKRCPFILNAQFYMDNESHRFYEITDFLDENSLRAELRRKTFTQEEKLTIIFNLIEALRVAHNVDVFHRDLNPENIYLTSGCAALANFGKAYFADHSEMGYTVAPSLNETNATAYHAPEMLAKDASRASDIYSMGVLIYELFTGKLPFETPYDLNKLGGKLTTELMPTAVKIGLPAWLDELCTHTILWDDTDRWDNIEELDNFIKYQLSNSHVSSTQQTPAIVFEELKPGLRIGDFTLYSQLGKGGFSTVFKAKHNIQSKDYAIKIFNESITMQTVVDEYNALAGLNNPHIVKFSTNGTLPNGQFFTLMEYLDGNNMQEYTKGDLKLPLQIIFQLAKEILNALVCLQNQQPAPIFHRDVKPQNIVWDKQDRFVLIDFNVATAEETDKNFVGTNPYLAPDLQHGNKVNWDCSADTFALGITLYELICHSYPWSGGMKMPRIGIAPEPIEQYQTTISGAFASFIMKAINCNHAERFETAQAMLDELLAVGIDNLVKNETPNTSGEIFLTGDEDKTFVDYLNSLYSQSRYGNAGTRANFKTSAFDELTYTKTKLDTELLKAIIAGSYRLVIITGNAGDGKTAFIKQIENEASGVERLKNRNGAKFQINGIPYLSNYDGSQDEENRANNEVLSDFFQPFEHTSDFSSVGEGRIIAINEGRLVDFLQTSGNFKHLTEIIDAYFYNSGHTELPKGLMIINLNLRSVTAKTNGGESLFRSQIKKLTQPVLWSKCSTCPHAGYCFTKYNVDTLTDSAAGDEVINRLEWLMRTISYKRELHITMRDLRSFIAYLISRDCRCADIPVLYQKYSEQPEKYWQYFYFNITSPDAEPSNDRLISLMREADLSQVSIPSIDRDLYFGLHEPKDYLDFSDRPVALLDIFNANKILLPAYEMKDEILEKLTLRHRVFVRHQYFEGKFEFKKRLPYQSLEDFHNLLTDSGNNELAMLSAKQSLAQAISISEGCTEMRLSKNYLLLRSSRISDPISQSFRRFSIDDFELFVNKSEHLVQFIEYESDSIIFRNKNKNEQFISLTVSLDLYEMLFFIKQGFSPSINDMRGRFIELQVFKNLLENKSYDEVLITKNNKSFFVISLEQKTNKLTIAPLSL
jgi:serine/threonine protein kinase